MNAAASTAINPNDFIVIPSSLKYPDTGSAPPLMNGIPAVPPPYVRSGTPKRQSPTAFAAVTMPEILIRLHA
jgi:hypothetical protein